METELNPQSNSQVPDGAGLSFSWMRILKISAIVIVIAGLGAGVYLGITSRPFKIAWASWVLDSHNDYLTCYELPFFPQVQKAVTDHPDTIGQLKNLGASSVTAVKIKCKAWDQGIEFIKGDILIQYQNHAQRVAIEKLLGKTFFGIPYVGEKK